MYIDGMNEHTEVHRDEMEIYGWVYSWCWWPPVYLLFQCWPRVLDGGPMLNQHWVGVSCLLRQRRDGNLRIWCTAGVAVVAGPADMVLSINARLMLGQRRRRWWPNISQALVECTILLAIPYLSM